MTRLLAFTFLMIGHFAMLGVASTTAQDATMVYPVDVAADSQGTIYVADRQLPGILKIVDGKAEVFFQADKKFRTPLNAIRCLAFDDQDRLYAGCSTTTEVYRIDDGKPVALSGGKVSVPMNMMVDGSQLIVCDLKMRFLDSIPVEGGELKELAMIQGAKAVAKAESGYVVLTGLEDAIVTVDADGKVSPFVGKRPFNYPADMVQVDQDHWVVSDSYEKCLWKVQKDGTVEKWVTDERFSNLVGLCKAGEDVIVCDSRANAIFRISPDKQVTVVVQGQPTP